MKLILASNVLLEIAEKKRSCAILFSINTVLTCCYYNRAEIVICPIQIGFFQKEPLPFYSSCNNTRLDILHVLLQFPKFFSPRFFEKLSFNLSDKITDIS